MARDVVARMLRLSGRLLIWCMLLVVLVTLPVLGMLGSETGSRWLLERGLGMQRMLTLEVRGGTLLGGMELAEVRLHTRKSDLYIRRVLARWSLLHLLRGEIDILEAQADGVTLTLTSPPSRDPVRLPRVILPLALDIHSLELTDVRLRKRGSEWPVARIAAKGYWRGATVTVDRLLAQEPRYGGLALAGEIRLLGGYPLQASGQVSPRWLTEKGWQPLQVSLGGEVANLDVKASSRGRYHADLTGNVRPLLPDLPYNATLKWSDLFFPWFTEHRLDSREGQVKVIGTRQGLRSQGRMALQTRYTPQVTGQWQLDMDWRHITFESLKINGLNGEINAMGDIGWHAGLNWDMTAALSKVDLARHWPVARSVAPVLSGSFASKGHSRKTGSSVEASLRLVSGERWTLTDKASGVLWAPKSAHQAVTTWRAVTRPVAGLKFVQSDAGRLEFAGNRRAYRAVFDAGMTTGKMPSGDWRGTVAGSGGRLKVEALSYAGAAGALQASGDLDVSKGIAWQGSIILDNFSSDWLLPNWSGHFSGNLGGRFAWMANRREVDLDQVDINGQLRGLPLRLQGPLSVTLGNGSLPRFASPGFQAEWGGNSLAISGGLQDQWDATADVALTNLATLMPALQGQVTGQVVLSGSERQPDVMADLVMEHGAFAGFRLASARLQAVVPVLGEAQSDVSLQINGLTSNAGLSLGDLSLSAKGVVGEHRLEWSLQGAPVTLAGALAGGLDRATSDWNGLLRQGQATLWGTPWNLTAVVPLSWHRDSGELRLAAHCWNSEPASLCATEPLLLGPAGRVAMSLRDFNTESLAAFMPEGLSWLGSLAGDLTADWQPGQPAVAQAHLHSGSGEFRLARDEALPLSLRYDQFSLAIDAGAAAVNAVATLASTDLGAARLDATVNPFLDGKPVTGEVALSGMRLELLQPFFPALSQLSGLVSAEGRIDGSLARPRYWGNVQLREGRMALRNVPLAADDMSAWVDVQGDRADFTGQLRSGEGGATLAGNAEWQEQPRMSLSLQGSRFAVRQEPEIRAELNPDLRIELQPGQLGLTGSVQVPYARINLKKMPERSVGLSPDVRVLESDDRRLRVSTTRRGQAVAINADVELVLGDDVFFNGFGVSGALQGGVHLRQSAQRGLEAYGELGLDKEARYDAYGQKLKVRSGRLVFAGNIAQPAIDAEAVREVDDKVVGIRVEGRANAPEATLFSEPSMPQADMLSYLVLGRPLAQRAVDGSSSGNDAMLAAAAIKLGARGGEGLTSGIGSVLGVRDFSLDAEGSGDDTQVKVSGYLSPDLYLSYGVGVFTPVNTITMRYQVRPRLYLEAISSIENAIDLFYNFRF